MPGNSKLNQDVGRRIRLLRESAGMQIIQLAPLVDLSPSDLIAIEEGRMRPRPETVVRLTQELKVPIGAFFDDSRAQEHISATSKKSADDR
jgi:transcriptional regulator with XRE-family HTH domain